MIKMIKITCATCGYEWVYRGTMMRTKCPRCMKMQIFVTHNITENGGIK
jgi:predicted RNA-binding Zn-ribbon protein involved in translation (DUF1610 family)